MEFKSQVTSQGHLYGQHFVTFDGVNPYGVPETHDSTFLGRQEILTEDHPGFRNPNGGDVGGPFHNHKTEVEIDSSSGDFSTGNITYRGDLSFAGVAPWGSSFLSFPNHVSLDTNDRIFALGGTAISRTLPTNPVGGAATFLGELREGFPTLIGSSLIRDRAKDALKAQKAGHEYLNVEFGWKPLVADIRKFALGVKNHDRIVAQLSRDSGRNVRRSYKFPLETSSNTIHSTATYLLGGAGGWTLPSDVYVSPGHDNLYTFESKRTWFSGCFSYHLPDYNEMFGIKRYVAEADKVLGVKLTPEVLWNLAPWSWAADWFANTGDVMNNLSQFSQNDMALRYGYVMQEAKSGQLRTGTQMLIERGKGPKEHHATFKLTATRQTRQPASPFGFGFTFSDFSPRQLAIASALGISRVR